MALVKNRANFDRSAAPAPTASKTRKTRTLVKQQQTSESIADIANILLDNAQESVSAVEELKSSMDQIATAAEENSGASEQVLEGVNHRHRNLDKMFSTIEKAIQTTLNTGTVITSAVDQVNSTVEKMVVSADIAKESSQKSEELKTSSQNIGEAVGFIAKIADQTNLLALNAAIEASRAKEHGKGFAVVASETRALAGNSEKNAQFIDDLVNNIQVSIDQIINSITGTTGIIEKTGIDGRKLSLTLEELTKIADYSVEAARNANTFTQELLSSADFSQKASEEIAEVSAKIAIEVEKTFNAIEIQASSLAQTEDDIKELTELSEELKYSTDTAKSSEDIAVSADALSSSVETIQESMTDVTSSLNDIEQLSARTNENAIKTKEVVEGATKVSDDINSVITIVRNNFDILKGSFAHIKTTILAIKADFERSIVEGGGADSELGKIKRESRNVEKTVRNISNSIIQLNMLAISGSIEAARAGDFGKGFEVVSADIRNLAQDSESNTEKINDTIEGMNSEIESVSSDWNNLLKTQEGEKNIIDALVLEIDRITGMISDVVESYQNLKMMNDMDREGLTAMLGGIEEIQKAIELSATNAAESRKASELIIETITNMSDGIEELAVLADELQQG
ncbi:MAG TPA: methyl-accepting chemotaxis protein [Campylobacterales bacterium]|nr:methyl-accepting chemotaxis protein [Campylobacterales bacterium]